MSPGLGSQDALLVFSFSVQSQLFALSPPERGLKEASPPILGDCSQRALKDIWGEAALLAL